MMQALIAITPELHLSREEWAAEINKTHVVGQFAAAIISYAVFKTGDALRAAKADLEHGEFQAMIRNDLSFDVRMAQIYMQIAGTPHLRNAKHVSRLPPKIGTLALLARMPEPDFHRLIEDGTISPDLERPTLTKILRAEKIREDEIRVLGLGAAPGRYRTLVFDPAWQYEVDLDGRGNPGYATQSFDELLAMADQVDAWAEDDCHLWLWATNAMLAKACELVKAWGFTYQTALTWVKTGPFGMGSYLRGSTEHALFATRGTVKTRPAAASISTHFDAERGEHSEKPDRFYEIVRSASYGPYGEGNQRTPREGFVNLFPVKAMEANGDGQGGLIASMELRGGQL